MVYYSWDIVFALDNYIFSYVGVRKEEMKFGELPRISILNRNKYKGKGRPRKSDYDWTTLGELQKGYNEILSRKVDNLMRRQR